MGVLANKDFDNGKTAATGPYAGKTRHEIVLAKIADGKDFLLGSNGTGGKVKGVSYDPKTKAFSYQKKTGKKDIITCSTITGAKCNIFKDPDFGGGGGAGGGSQQTAWAESAQCVWLIVMQTTPGAKNKDFGFFTTDKLKKAYDNTACQVGNTTWENINSLPLDWHKSGWLSAKKIIDAGYYGAGYTLHRDSAIMKKIYSQRATAYKNSNMPPVKEDKWNPGDIWAVKNGFDVSTLDTSSINAYNKDILKAFKNKNLIGISLKAVKRAAKVSVINETNYRPDDVTYEKGMLSSDRGTFFSNKSGVIVYGGQGGGKMEIRTNSALSTHKVEIMLKTARGGGAGWGEIKDIIKDELNVVLPENTQLKAEAQKIASDDTTAINKFWKMVGEANATDGMKKSEFLQELAAKDVIWIHSKLGCLYLIHTIETKTKKIADKAVNRIFNYAGSMTDTSSVYIKVYE